MSSGLENDVLVAANVNFNNTGAKPHTGIITTDGQLLIGSTAAPKIQAGTLTSTDSSITIGYSSPNITLQVAGGTTVGKTITGNSGGALSPTAGNWNIQGTGSITTSGAGSTLTGQLTGLTNHSVLVGAGTATITKVAPSATSGVPLISQGAAADPVFGTAVVAGGGTGATTLTGVLTGNGTSAITANAVTNHGILLGGASNAVSSLAVATNGQLPIGSTGADPVLATISQGNGITVTNGAGTISIAGFAIQQVRTLTSSLLHITSTHTVTEDVIPQNTYGTEVMTVTITPKSATSILIIEVHVFGFINAGGASAGMGLFQDSTANALAMVATSVASNYHNIVINHSMTSGTTSATTFKIRIWPDAASFDVNGANNTRVGGGVASTSIIVTEYAS